MVVDLEAPIAENFPGVEQVFRIEHRLDLAHDLQQFLADLLRHVFSPGHADSVLGREGSFELPDECRDLVGNEAILPHVFRRVQVEDRSDMQQAGCGMAVIAHLEAERPHDRVEPGDVGRQVRRPDRRVFDKGDWLGRAFPTRQQRKARLSQQPDQIHLGRFRTNGGAQTEALPGQQRQPFRHVVIKFDDQNRLARLGIELEQLSRRFEMELPFRLVEQGPVDVLDGGRLELEKFDCRLHRFGHRSEEDQAEPLFTRERNDF
jgi:hypothetical protein